MAADQLFVGSGGYEFSVTIKYWFQPQFEIVLDTLR